MFSYVFQLPQTCEYDPHPYEKVTEDWDMIYSSTYSWQFSACCETKLKHILL